MEKQLPEEFELKKISLSSLNVSGFAWTREDFLKFLEHPISSQFAILGGDVLLIQHGELSYTYDNWYVSDRQKTESFTDFCRRGHAEALRYLNAYPKKDNVVFSPTLTSEVTAGWLR